MKRGRRRRSWRSISGRREECEEEEEPKEEEEVH
jgi:hypothetical protein